LASKYKYFRKKTRKIRRYSIYILTLIFRRLLLLIPCKIGFLITDVLSYFACLIFYGERKKIKMNLELAFGNEKSEEDIKKITFAIFRNMGRTAAETLYWPKLGVDYLKKHVRIENEDILYEAFKKGKGIIGLTGHFGNWEYLAASVSGIMGLRFAVIARKYSNPWQNALLEENRKSMGVDVIYRGESGISILRRLKRNEGLGILADQNIRGDCVYVNFFNKPAKTLSSVAELILRTGTPVIPIFIIRNNDLTTHRMIVENPLFFSLTGNKKEDIKIISETYTKILEKYIRRYPEQWMWMHDRWGIHKK
jgi:Kdo2-lipid IVA lauroyltransferase/acyltransferase